MTSSPLRPVDALVLGELDSGNLGNDGTFAVFLAGIRARSPETAVRVLGYGTHRLADVHGVEEAQMNAGRRFQGGAVGAVNKIVARAWDIPRTAGHVRHARAVVIAGTGLFEGDHRMSFVGWPFAFWRTAVAARLLRRPLIILRVGASPVTDRASRTLFRSGLRGAATITCRDARSADVIAGWIGRRPEVTADLVFAHEPVVPSTDRPFVALGVMAAGGGTRGTHEGTHVDARIGATRGLLDRGEEVDLIFGDEMDRETLDAVAAAFAGDNRVRAVATPDLESLITHLAGARHVIATRFHNVIAGLLSGRPTVAVSYAEKTRDLMSRVGLGDYVLDAAGISASAILDAFDRSVATGARPDSETVETLRAAARGDVARAVDALR